MRLYKENQQPIFEINLFLKLFNLKKDYEYVALLRRSSQQ